MHRVGAKRVRYTLVEEVLNVRDEGGEAGATRNDVRRLCFVVDIN